LYISKQYNAQCPITVKIRSRSFCRPRKCPVTVKIARARLRELDSGVRIDGGFETLGYQNIFCEINIILQYDEMIALQS